MKFKKTLALALSVSMLAGYAEIPQKMPLSAASVTAEAAGFTRSDITSYPGVDGSDVSLSADGSYKAVVVIYGSCTDGATKYMISKVLDCDWSALSSVKMIFADAALHSRGDVKSYAPEAGRFICCYGDEPYSSDYPRPATYKDMWFYANQIGIYEAPLYYPVITVADANDNIVKVLNPDTNTVIYGSPEEELWSAMLEAAPELANEVTGSGAAINASNFPDSVFRGYVSSNFDTDGNGLLSAKEAREANEVNLPSSGVSSLAGIEYLTSLTKLVCSGNSISSLDLSKNTALQQLDCSKSNVGRLNVSGCASLITLQCGGNKLTSLDVSGCSSLVYLDCSDNSLASLRLSSSVENLNCSGNKLTSLDVSGCSALSRLYCYNNALSSLDVTRNTKLTNLDCADNALTEIDVRQNPALTSLRTDYNIVIRCLPGSDAEDYAKANGIGYTDSDGNASDFSSRPVITSEAGEEQVTVTCTEVKGAVGYRLLYTSDNGNTFTNAGESDSRTWVVKMLTPGVEYKFLVLVNNGSGWSKYKKGECYAPATPTAAGSTAEYPPKPANVEAQPDKRGAALLWTAVEGAVKYSVYYTADNGESYTFVGETKSRTYPVTGLTPGMEYKFLVLAYDGTNWSKYEKGECYAPVIPRGDEPEKPQRVTSTAGVEQITVICSPVIGAVSYKLLYTTDSGVTYEEFGESTMREWLLTGLTPGVEYKFLVLAYDGTNWSKYEKGECYAPATPIASSSGTAPAKPAQINSTAGVEQITVTCSEVSGATSYKLLYTTDNGRSYKTFGESADRQWTLTGLTAGTEYKFLVLAYDGKNWSKYENGECYAAATPKAPETTSGPAKPDSVTSVAGVEQVTVICSAVSGATTYKLLYTTDNGSSYKAFGESKTRQWIVTGLTPGTEYKFLVLSYDGKSWSSYKNGECYAAATPLAKAGAPAKPGNVTSAAGVGQITVTWSAVSGATRYRLLYTTDNGRSYKTFGETTATRCTLTGLTAGIVYKFLVLAYNGELWSEYKEGECYAAATPLDASPAKPESVTSVAGERQVTVVCSAVTGAVSYKLFYTTDNGINYTYVSESKSRQWIVTGLTAGTEYKFLVLAYDGKLWSNYKKGECYAAAVPTAPAPAQPSLVKSKAGADSITVTCSTVKGAKKYRLFYTADNGRNYKKVGDTTARKWVVTGLITGVEYKFLVLAYDGSKWSTYKKGQCAAPAVITIARPTTVKATAGKGKAVVTCSTVKGAKTYRLFYTADNGKTYKKVGDTPSRKWTVTGLKSGATYKFLVLAYDGKSWSKYTKGECTAEVKIK